MENLSKNKSRGEIPSVVLFGALGVLVVIMIIVIVNSFIKKSSVPPEEPQPQGPIQEVVVGDVKFKLKETKDLGSLLRGSESKNPTRQQDITTTDRFIEVTITAENVGKENVNQGTWDLKDLFDKEERRFVSSYETNPWVPEESKCGDLLKPGFTPTSCTKIYEVANVSSDLKVKVSARSASPLVAEEGFIDLGF